MAMPDPDEQLAWLREAYARDAMTLGCFEWMTEGVLAGDPGVLSLFDPPMQPWPADSRVTGEFAYDVAC